MAESQEGVVIGPLPPSDIWEVNQSLQLDEHLEGAQDPRWVDTERARGEYSLTRLCRALGVDRPRRKLTAPAHGYYLFCGHRGSGKSTELRRIVGELHDRDFYYVVFADAAQELDVNNLRYQDVLLHLASRLMQQLVDDGIQVEEVHLGKLQEWFTERVEKTTSTRDFALEAKAGIGSSVGLPFVAKLFGHFSTAFKTNTTYKEELRTTLRNHFSDFADGFNHLLTVAEESLPGTGKGVRILFVIDGTDRLSGDDAQAFFEADVHQLQQVSALFVYCAPVHLAYEGASVGQSFSSIFRLPMVKLFHGDGTPHGEGLTAMEEMLHRRAAAELFDDDVADHLIKHSGGHPRDLLRLLLNAFKHAESDRFDCESAKRAVREMAADFRRILNPEDYRLLAAIDKDRQPATGSERIRYLLYNTALLEYNDYFWRSHPVVRSTQEYEAAQKSLAGSHE